MRKYRLIGASQEGILRNGESIKINQGDVIADIPLISLWDKMLNWFGRGKWYYFTDFRTGSLFRVSDSIIERYFEEVK